MNMGLLGQRDKDIQKCVRDQGYYIIGQVIDQEACQDIRASAQNTDRFGPQLFMDEAEFNRNPIRSGTNPRPGRNLADSIDLSAIETNPAVCQALTAILGAGYRQISRKLVCGVPRAWMPEWVSRDIADAPNGNLGPYIKEQYRDITYFHGIDYHQDVIDYRNRAATMVTLYVYLHEVTSLDAPLFVLPKSHQLGVTVFPHNLKPVPGDPGRWAYSDDLGNSLESDSLELIGPTGTVAMWHACLLHGTQPTKKDNARLSLRYVFDKAADQPDAYIDTVNASLRGPLQCDILKRYSDEAGAVVISGNAINSSPTQSENK